MGHHNHHLLQNLRMLGNVLEEVKLAFPPPELTENQLLDVPLDAFNRTSILPELEVDGFACATSFRSPELEVIILGLDIERLDVRKASEETRQHPGFKVGSKFHLNSQHLNAWDSGVWTCLGVSLQIN